MELDGSHKCDMEVKQRTADSNILLAQESSARSDNYRKKVLYEIGHNGRQMTRASGEEQCDVSPTIREQTSHAIFLLQRKKKSSPQDLCDNQQGLQ